MANLEDLQLDGRQLAFLEWLLVPREMRAEQGVPTSEKKYAEHIHVDVTTLRRWKGLAQFRKQWNERSMELQGTPERTDALLESLYEQGRGSKEKCEHCGQRGGDVRAAELWGRWTGQLKAEPKVQVEVTNTRELSDEQLDQLLRQTTEDELARRRAKTA